MLIFLPGFALSVLAAVFCSRLPYKKQESLLNILAVLLPLSEVWKQLLLTYIHEGTYQLWYFPFQLCSMPLYLLPLRQLLSARRRTLTHRRTQTSRKTLTHRRTVQTLTDFLADFGLLAGIFAFADQTGMHYSLSVLTLHSYLWHFIMIFLGLFLHLSGSSPKSAVNKSPADKPAVKSELLAKPASFSFRKSLKSFLPPALLFLLLAGIAELLNCLLHTRGSIDMFYISPWEPSTQVILRSVADRFGRRAEIVLYLCLIFTGAGLIHVCSRFLSCRFSRFSSSSTD